MRACLSGRMDGSSDSMRPTKSAKTLRGGDARWTADSLRVNEAMQGEPSSCEEVSPPACDGQPSPS